MKRIAAISLLLILVFNCCGYRLVLACMDSKATEVLEKKLDAADYKDSELISIKTVLHLPYYTSTAEFERAYGSVNLNGEAYEYVKRRVHNDTLELLCLPNHSKTKLQATGNDLAKATADGSVSTNTKKIPTTVKVSLPDFCQRLCLPVFSPFALMHTASFPERNAVALNGYGSLQERPPQAA